MISVKPRITSLLLALQEAGHPAREFTLPPGVIETLSHGRGSTTTERGKYRREQKKTLDVCQHRSLMSKKGCSFWGPK